jgi:DNA sulfur modification protein DndE
MKPPVESVRVSPQGRDQLIKLKRQTGVENWNVLCRWALCCSLRERAVPPRPASATEGGVEMSWKVFAGESSNQLAAVILKRALADGFADSPDGAALCLRAHLHRGLGYLASEKEINGISGFLARWLKNQRGDKIPPT